MPAKDPISSVSPSTGPSSPEVTGILRQGHRFNPVYRGLPGDEKRPRLIDVVLDFDPEAARTRTDSAEHILDLAQRAGYTIEWVLDTHPHADHVMASSWLKQHKPAPRTRSARRCTRSPISGVATTTSPMRSIRRPIFDHLFADGRHVFHRQPRRSRPAVARPHARVDQLHSSGRTRPSSTTPSCSPTLGRRGPISLAGRPRTFTDSLMAILDLPGDTRLFHRPRLRGGPRAAKNGGPPPPLEGNPRWPNRRGTNAQYRWRAPARRTSSACAMRRDATLPLPDRHAARAAD